MLYKAKEVYQDQDVALKYDQRRFVSLKGRLVDKREKSIILKAIQQSGVTPPARILDIPCGTGRLSVLLAEKGYQVTGVDVSAAMIAQGEKKIKDNHQITFEVGDGESLSYEDSYFDLAVSLRLFGHLPPANRLNMLKELSRVTKSFVAVSYYQRNSLQEIARRKSRLKKDISWHPVNFKEIDTELAKANLKRINSFFLLRGISETVIVLAEKI